MAGRLGQPRILFIDIETLPILGYAWSAYDTCLLKIVEPTVICCWSAQWLGGRNVTRALCDYPKYKPGSRDDKELCRDLWKLLDEADEVVGHNEKSFDVKILTNRFMVHKFKPYAPFTMFDTLREYKKIAKADQHKLAHLLTLHELGEKLDSGGAALWFGCEAGDPKAWAKMKRYNRNDTAELLPLYQMLLPWARSHLNQGMWTGGTCCPKCGSGSLQRRGTARNRTTEYERFQCQSCGGWARGAVNLRKGKPLVSA